MNPLAALQNNPQLKAIMDAIGGAAQGVGNAITPPAHASSNPGASPDFPYAQQYNGFTNYPTANNLKALGDQQNYQFTRTPEGGLMSNGYYGMLTPNDYNIEHTPGYNTPGYTGPQPEFAENILFPDYPNVADTGRNRQIQPQRYLSEAQLAKLYQYSQLMDAKNAARFNRPNNHDLANQFRINVSTAQDPTRGGTPGSPNNSQYYEIMNPNFRRDNDANP